MALKLRCDKCNAVCESVADKPGKLRCPKCGIDARHVTLVIEPATGADNAEPPRKLASSGQIIGGCKLLEVIGRGGMGVVYKAHHLALDIPVAVKILLANAAVFDPHCVERFVLEARSAARLQHQNIVGVLNVGEENDTHYIVMQFVEGRTLQDLLDEKGELPVADALSIGAQICDALELVRHHQIVHRDIKPANIIIAADGVAKLMDLGVAKNTGSEVELTQANVTLGTPMYMSPEQGRGAANADHRSDLYALGCTLYRVLCGKTPYSGSSALAVLRKHQQEAVPDPRAANPAMPPGLAAAIMRLLAKSPAERYQTARELGEELRRLQRQLEGKAEPADDRPTTLGNARILVVDDIRQIRFFFRATLTKAEARVVEAENGLEALHALTKAAEQLEPFDLVITDVHMPRMDGIELLRHLRADPDLRETPVIVITMEEQESVVLEFARLGISSYLVKPPKGREILDAARQALDATSCLRHNRQAQWLESGMSAEKLRLLHQSVADRVHAGLGRDSCPVASVLECPAYMTMLDHLQKHAPAALDD